MSDFCFLPGVLLGLIVCSSIDTRVAPVAMCVHLGIMCSIVYRSSQQWTTVLRTVVASVGMGYVELVVLETASWSILRIVMTLWFAYYHAVTSEYMLHRFVMHGHCWQSSPQPVLFRALQKQYFIHTQAHHRHCRDVDTTRRMYSLHPSPMSPTLKRDIEQRSEMRGALEATNHGFTTSIQSAQVHHRLVACMDQVLMMFVMSAGTAVLLRVGWGNPLDLLVSIVPLVFSVYLNIHHDKYHAGQFARGRWTRRRWALSRWFWNSREMSRLSIEHLQHHHHDHHYHLSVLPFNRYFLYPIWQSW
jgi:hypothetical protein